MHVLLGLYCVFVRCLLISHSCLWYNDVCVCARVGEVLMLRGENTNNNV